MGARVGLPRRAEVGSGLKVRSLGAAVRGTLFCDAMLIDWTLYVPLGGIRLPLSIANPKRGAARSCL